MTLRAALKIIAADKARLALALSAVAVMATTAVTFGSWSVSSSAGSGYSKAKVASSLTLSDASASTTAQLYPGGTGADWRDGTLSWSRAAGVYGVVIDAAAGTVDEEATGRLRARSPDMEGRA